MAEIPKRPETEDYTFPDYQLAVRRYEHAVAVRAVEALRQAHEKLRIEYHYTSDHCPICDIEYALRDIEASGWKP